MGAKELIKIMKAKKIVVIGHQRSGTTIATKIFAHELGYPALYEEDIKSNRIDVYNEFYEQFDSYVVQGTGLTPICEIIKCDLLIFMLRPAIEIKRSVQRIRWDELGYEQMVKDAYGKTNDRRRSWTIAKAEWKRQKNKLISPYIELEYRSLSYHKFWVSERKHFGERQTA